MLVTKRRLPYANLAKLRCAQIETLAGQVLAAEVDSGASLVAMRAGIERETGVLAEQQRFIILGMFLCVGCRLLNRTCVALQRVGAPTICERITSGVTVCCVDAGAALHACESTLNV